MSKFFHIVPFIGFLAVVAVGVPMMHAEANDNVGRSIGRCFDRGMGASSVFIPGTFYRLAWVCTK